MMHGAYEVKCKDGHIDGLIWETKAEAIAAWNRRAPEAQP
jgi:hypothetical protein